MAKHLLSLLLGCNVAVYGQALASNLRYKPVTPCRVLDTRDPGRSALAPWTSTLIAMAGTGVPCGFPATAKAWAVNITIVPTGSPVQLTLWPDGQALPAVVTINNSEPGRILARNAIVGAGPNGAIRAYSAGGSTHIIVDVNGYFSTDSDGLVYFPLTPCRVADTRNPTGPFGGPALIGGSGGGGNPSAARSFSITGSGGGAPSNATAFMLNSTVVPISPGEPLGYMTVFPTGSASLPFVSTLNNIPTGRILANGGIHTSTNSSQAV